MSKNVSHDNEKKKKIYIYIYISQLVKAVLGNKVCQLFQEESFLSLVGTQVSKYKVTCLTTESFLYLVSFHYTDLALHMHSYTHTTHVYIILELLTFGKQ